MLKSITKSKQIIGIHSNENTVKTMLPDIAALTVKSWEELRQMRIAQVEWLNSKIIKNIETIAFTLNSGLYRSVG
jgi:hypothetical protein